jgi:hypothetical protein
LLSLKQKWSMLMKSLNRLNQRTIN